MERESEIKRRTETLLSNFYKSSSVSVMLATKPENLSPEDPGTHYGGRREQTPHSSPLTSTHRHTSAHAHINNNNNDEVKQFKYQGITCTQTQLGSEHLPLHIC